jgi:hypothetical protein
MNMTTESDSREKLAGFLHVVFHGAFCFVDQKEAPDIMVLVPLVTHTSQMDMTEMDGKSQGKAMPTPTVAEHAYIAGNWLNERSFIRGAFELRGVVRGNATFDPSKILSLNGAKPGADRGDLYAVMRFPRPLRIESLQRGPVESKFTGKDVGLVKQVREVSTVQVFTYRFEDDNQLELYPHPKSAFSGKDRVTGGFCSLHLFAEPDDIAPKPHSHHAFKAALAMYRKETGENIDLDVTPPEVEPVEQPDVPYGMILAELQDLPTRLNRLSALGVRRLLNENLNGVLDDSDEQDAGDPLNCLSFLGYY